MEARLAETGALSQLVSEPGDPWRSPCQAERKAWEGGEGSQGGEGWRMLGGKEKSFLISNGAV